MGRHMKTFLFFTLYTCMCQAARFLNRSLRGKRQGLMNEVLEAPHWAFVLLKTRAFFINMTVQTRPTYETGILTDQLGWVEGSM